VKKHVDNTIGPSVTVITPTIGNQHVRKCVESVAAQTYGNVRHTIVVDGNNHLKSVQNALEEWVAHVDFIVLPHSTGSHQYFGHRIYGATPYLVNTDYIAYLDEDNWFDPSHIQTLVKLCLQHDLDWAYALRRIVDWNGTPICEDNCESLGFWGAWCNGQSMIDTNCYFLRREVAVEAAPIWHRKGYSTESCDPDKALCRWLIANKVKGFTSGDYTVNYRLGSSENSALKSYFIDGNTVTKNMYKYFPWYKPTLETIHQKIDFKRVITSGEMEALGGLKWSGKGMLNK